MKGWPWLLLSIALIACTGNQSEVSRQLAGADSVQIQFNAPQSNLVEKAVSATDKNAIKKLKQFVEGKPAEAYKCGYTGNLQFFANGKIAGDFSFNTTEGCRHFIQLKDGQLQPTVMSNEAADFLQSLGEGRGWY